MPTYVYKDDKGREIELVMSIAEMQKRQRKDGTIVEDGKTFKRVYTSGRAIGLESSIGWPIVSEGAAIRPSDIPEWQQFDRSRGCKTEYTKDGRPIFRDRNHRRKYLAAHGLHDRNGGYGD